MLSAPGAVAAPGSVPPSACAAAEAGPVRAANSRRGPGRAEEGMAPEESAKPGLTGASRRLRDQHGSAGSGQGAGQGPGGGDFSSVGNRIAEPFQLEQSFALIQSIFSNCTEAGASPRPSAPHLHQSVLLATASLPWAHLRQ